MTNELTVLPDGSTIDETGKVVEQSKDIRELVPARIRRLDELPKAGKMYAVIAALEMWGLLKIDIAQVLDRSVDDLDVVMSSTAYKEFRSDMVDGVLDAETNDVRQIFVANAARAARGITSLMDSNVPEVRGFAMKETLDRGGFRPADIVEHRHKIENDLRIVYTKDEPLPIVDATFTEVE